MYLKSLELHGFKSFPDKIKLDFNKGISAVVGPNGSGKSNIGDAMRWVMGEQSSKTLRGGKMEDVIFNGTKDRPAAGFAQVTLSIDNEDRSLSLDNDIVSVSRKLYRNGDSEYMINGKNVRLKDIVELFMDTGLGRDGYSIIGQGKIADIVSSKSTERREIFEEAAGISKFRYKKAEAERKLKSAEDNISRLNDILSEIEDRVGPLQKQCEKAKKFKVLYDKKSSLEVSVWVMQLKKLRNSVNESKEKLGMLDEQYKSITVEIEEIDKEVEESFLHSAESSKLIDDLKEKIHNIELDNSQADSKIAVLDNDIKHIEKSILQINEQITQSENSKYFLENELKLKKENLIEIEKKRDLNDNEINEVQSSFSNIQEKSDNYDKTLADSNNELSVLYLKKSEITYKLETLKNSISETEEKISACLEDKTDFENRNKLAKNELSDLTDKKEKSSEHENELNNKLSGLVKLLENKKNKLSEIQEIFNDTDRKLHDTKQRLGIIRDLENSMEGFAYSVKNILSAAKQRRISGICGSVAQIISVPSEYTVAVETALGAALQNIIVENEDAAKRGIRYLKDSKAGRATFLPLTSVKGQGYKDPPVGENGYISMADKLVEYDSKYDGIIKYLLGRICIAEDIDLATVISKKYGYRFKIVTLDGQVINAGGSFTGGSTSKNTGILSRKNEIDKLEIQKKALEEKFEKFKTDKERLSQETAKYTADIEGVRDQISESTKETLRIDMDIKRISEFAQQYGQRLENVENEIQSSKEKLEKYQSNINVVNKELSDTDKKIIEGEMKLQDSQDLINSLKNEREQLSQKLSELKIKQIELLKDDEACRLSISQIEENINGSSVDKNNLTAQIDELKRGISDKEKEIENIKNARETSSSDIAKIKNLIFDAQNKHREYDAKANKLRQEEKIKTDEKETLSNEINRITERVKSSEGEFDKLVGKLWDDYKLTQSEAEQKAEPVEDIVSANKELSELRSKINGLGHVNLGAIEEYAEVSERYEFMKHQLDDVLTSKHELEELITNLTENMKEMFIDSFNKINKNFKEIFKELFGGGSGELVLEDYENVLECGIEIKVEPPGKIIKNLLSLSGGEQAFVAVCIYFSILKIRPSPFCLLDEIEAALDDANVSRYAQYLHRFTDTTQFITITHRRGTMEEADVLYGVTMQQKGISKLLKMNPEDTVNLKLEE